MVRSIKSALKKSLGTRCLTFVELETTVQEVEACINSRPLTFVGDEINALSPLTPSHFLMGTAAGVPSRLCELPSVPITANDLKTREIIRLQCLENYWSRWSEEYLKSLPFTLKGFTSRCTLKEGSVVLIREDNTPRLSWPLGVVIQLFPGKDGIPRSVKLRTAKGFLTRSVQRLHDLEIANVPPIVSPNDSPADIVPVNQVVSPESIIQKPRTSRVGRTIKSPTRLDL